MAGHKKLSGKQEWGNEDYDHNPQVDDDGQYAPDE